MSRSYKKTPISKSGGYGKNGKKLAGRKWRRTINENDIVGRRSLYKRNYSSYDIYDYVSRWTKEEAKRYYKEAKFNYENGINDWKYWGSKENIKYPTVGDFLKDRWEKYYRRK